jgi:hypothetical protein
MSNSAEIFEPKVIYSILKGLPASESEKKTFSKWGENVCSRLIRSSSFEFIFACSRSRIVFKAGKNTGRHSREGKNS